MQTDDGYARVIASVPHAPTTKTRRQVEVMVACGLTSREVAHIFNCTIKEVESHYKDELYFGCAKINARVGAALLRNALQGDVNAQKFWLQSRARWVPATAIEHSGEVSVAERRTLVDEITKLAIGHAAATQGTVQ